MALIASMAAAGKPVLFASKNNEAVEVVRRKLAEILDDNDWTLRLGSKLNIDQEMARLIDKAVAYTPLDSQSNRNEWQKLIEYIDKRQKIIDSNLKARQLLKDYIIALEGQRKYVSNLSVEWQNWWDENQLTIWPIQENRDKIKKYIEDVEILSK